jgi:LPS sulfotransferase NodH
MAPVRYIIVSSPRCGTHLVSSALCSRDDVGVNEEPYNGTTTIYGANTTPETIWAGLFAPTRERKFRAANGFILHRSQGVSESAVKAEFSTVYGHGVWERLVATNTDIKIIEVGRRDCLRRYISHRTAKTTGEWQAHVPAPRDGFCIEIDPADVVQYVKYYDWLGETARQCIAGHVKMSVDYEDVVANPDKSFEAIQLFLGLDVQRLRPRTYLQQQRPLREVVTNYDEVVDHLKSALDYSPSPDGETVEVL